MTFASNSGIALQANETGIVPTVAQILPFLPKDKTKLFTLRDTLGWHEGEKVLGKYAFTPTWLGIIALVQALRTLDYNVQIIATLYGGNTLYGLKPAGIPITLAQVTGYADFAGWAVNTFPSQTLFAVSVWNEMNGQTNGGITNVDNQHAALANITNATVKVVRAENPAIKIIVGATGGDNIDGFIINTGKAGLDFTKADFLDTHPYISTAKGVATWARQLAAIRKAGIIIPCWFTEWGGKCPGDYGAGYINWFMGNIIPGDTIPVAGGNFFTLEDSAKFPMAGLLGLSPSPLIITGIGFEYQAALT